MAKTTDEPPSDEVMGSIRGCAGDALAVLGHEFASADPATWRASTFSNCAVASAARRRSRFAVTNDSQSDMSRCETTAARRSRQPGFVGL